MNLFTINNGKIETIDAAEFAREYCRLTTSPRGVEPVTHIRFNDDAQVWEVWDWGHQGNFPRQLIACGEFETEEAAQEKLNSIWLEEAMQDCDAPMVFYSYAEAEEFLKDQEEAEE